ncbi:MAG: T9SS type A sorting domain-containing protein [Bacteroidales bacterium]|nr:T9SS type A sorting domain-containing protein [Bacteroidales bacterium]
MKKGLLAIIAALTIGSAAMAQFTTSTGSDEFIDLGAKSSRTFTRQWVNIGTPFVATDVYGNTVKLQDFLDSGKFVVIDYSCTWCGPCWNLHISGMLEQINALPDFQVIWVECESSNTTQQIFGPRGGSGYASQTQGDWTHNANGDSIPYPIIDDDANRTCLRTCAQLYAGSVPTLMLVTPYGQYVNLSGYFSYQQVAQSITNIRSIANSAPRPGSAPQCKIDGPASGLTGFPVAMNALVNTVDPVTISWTFVGGTPASDTGYNVSTTFNANGPHRVILTVSNANGTDHDTLVVITRTIPANVISYTFGSTYSTGIGNNTSAKRYWAVSFPPEYLTNFPQVHHVEYYVNAQYPASYTAKVYSGSATAPQTELGSTTLNVTSAMGNGYKSFDFSSPIAVDASKTLWIVMSATSTFPVSACAYSGNPNSNWISSDGNTWQHINELMSSGTNYSWMLNVYSSVNGLGEVLRSEDVQLFPNPAADNVTIMADGFRYVDVIDMNGTTVMTVNDAKTINLGNLSSGVYVFRVVTDNGVAMRKVVKK